MGYSVISPTGMAHRHARITGNDIPDDVWHVIADFISDSEPPTPMRHYPMIRYMAVNRTFFDYSLDKRYGEVRWIKIDTAFLKTLRRLRCAMSHSLTAKKQMDMAIFLAREPLVAQHVQRLYIRAWFIQLLLQNRTTTPVAEKAKSMIKSSFKSVVFKFGKRYEEEVMPDRLSTKGVIPSLIAAVRGMTNVVELNFEWRDLPLNKDTDIFLTSTRASFDNSLRKLVLRAQIAKFKELLTITNFDNIEELDFHFDYRPGDGKDFQANPQDPDLQDLLGTVVTFINHRRLSLRTLSISSSASIDLADFFKALSSEPFPSLRRFAVQLPFSEKVLSNPSGILDILQTRVAGLQHVSLLSSWPEQINAKPVDRAVIYKHKVVEWTRVNDKLLSQGLYLSNLESLELPFVSIAKTIPLLRRSGDTLTRLRLADHYLSKDEVAEVVSVFSYRSFELQHLHFEVSVLDLPLILLLATRLPRLQSLIVVFNHVTYFLELEEYEGRHAVLREWRLHELAVFEKRHQIPDPDVLAMSSREESIERQVMHRFCTLVPSIRVLKGRRIV